MSRALRFALCAVLLVPFVAGAGEDVYRWVDTNGEEHYTDDLQTIPRELRKSAKKVEEPPVTRLPSPPPRTGGYLSEDSAPSTFSTRESAQGDGGTPAGEQTAEQRWRGEFGSARRRIAELERQIQADRELLDGGTLGPRINPAGGVAINPEAAAATQRLEENEKELVQARKDLEDLERRAGWDAVPFEWRKGE